MAALNKLTYPSVGAYVDALMKDSTLARMTISMAAEFLGVGVSTVNGHVDNGQIRASVVRGETRNWRSVLVHDVVAFKARKTGAVTSRVEKVREMLVEQARIGETATYGHFMHAVDLDHRMSRDRKIIGEILGEISTKSIKESGVMLSVLAVAKTTGLPNAGFFTLVDDLDLRRAGETDEALFERLKKAVFKKYRTN